MVKCQAYNLLVSESFLKWAVSRLLGVVATAVLFHAVEQARVCSRLFSSFLPTHPPGYLCSLGLWGAAGGVTARGAGAGSGALCNGYWREPGDASRAEATGAFFHDVKLPIFFSSESGRRELWPGATTAL